MRKVLSFRVLILIAMVIRISPVFAAQGNSQQLRPRQATMGAFRSLPADVKTFQNLEYAKVGDRKLAYVAEAAAIRN